MRLYIKELPSFILHGAMNVHEHWKVGGSLRALYVIISNDGMDAEVLSEPVAVLLK